VIILVNCILIYGYALMLAPSNLQFMLFVEGVLVLQYSIPNDGDGHLENRL